MSFLADVVVNARLAFWNRKDKNMIRNISKIRKINLQLLGTYHYGWSDRSLTLDDEVSWALDSNNTSKVSHCDLGCWVWFDGNWCFKSLQENVWSEKCRSSRLTARWRWSEFPILILVNRIANSWLFGSFENCLAIFFKSMEHGCFVRNFLKNIHLISWKAKIFKICEKKYPLFFIDQQGK